MSEEKPIPYFAVTVSAESMSKDILSILYAVRPEWKKEVVCQEKFSEGYINIMTCFYIQRDLQRNDGLVVRVNTDEGDAKVHAFGGDREREFQSMQLAQAAGCFPAICATFNNGLIYRYVKGRVMDYSDFNNPKIVCEVARKLYKFQSIDTKNIKLVNRKGEPAKLILKTRLYERIADLIDNIPKSCIVSKSQNNRFLEIRKELTDEILKNQYDFLQSTLDQLEFPVVLCHCDFHYHNVIYDEDTGNVNFLDYEVTAFGFENQDMARLLVQGPTAKLLKIMPQDAPEFTEAQRKIWTRAYADAKYECFGDMSDNCKEYCRQMIDIQQRIMNICQLFEEVVNILSRINIDFGLNFLDILLVYKERYFSSRSELPILKDRYLNLRNIINTEC